MKNHLKGLLSFCAITLISIAALTYYACQPTYLPKTDSKWQLFLRYLSYNYLTLKPDPFCNSDVPISKTPIDVVIPVIEKDATTLVLTIASVRSNVLQPIHNIYLIAPESPMLRKIALEHHCIFVLEDEVLPKFSKMTNRKGWIKQQYLKLNADTVVTCEHFLIIDADTILLRPQIFVKDSKTVLNILRDYWFKRKQMVQLALGFTKLHNLDFTSHHMLICKTKLKSLKEHLQKLHHKPWQDALDTLEIPEGSFSEYELYGNFVAQQFANEVELVLGSNKLFPRDGLTSIDSAREYLSSKYKSLTMHSFLTIEGITG
jgi:hypothetical protein